MDFTHQTVNHTTNLVELRCGAYIQTSESYWQLSICRINVTVEHLTENDLFMQMLNDLNESYLPQ